MKPHCPLCGYTKEDAAIHLDHYLCKGTIPGTRRKGSKAALQASVESAEDAKQKESKIYLLRTTSPQR